MKISSDKAKEEGGSDEEEEGENVLCLEDVMRNDEDQEE